MSTSATSVIPVAITPFTGRYIPHPVNRLASGIDLSFGSRRSIPNLSGDPLTPRLKSLGIPARGVTTRQGDVTVYLDKETVTSEDSLAEAKSATLQALKQHCGPSYDFSEDSQ